MKGLLVLASLAAASADVAVDIQSVCTDYCATVATACTGMNEIDFGSSTCQAACETWYLGDSTDTGADSVYCRLYHADVASQSESNAATHCPHAGPDGGGVCTACAEYCSIQSASCTGANAITFDNSCATDSASWVVGDETDTGADTVYCRIYHATVAGTSDSNAATHCPHAAPDGGGVCTVCAEYCAVQSASCTGDNAITFDSSCADDCAEYPVGSPSDTASNSAYCRIYHATVAGTSDSNAVTHCPHAAPDGGNVCVTAEIDAASGAAAAAGVLAAAIAAFVL